MKIQINNHLLSDSPHSESSKSVFISPDKNSEDLVQDIINGTATCYLISGYRGAGKSSFINRLESKVKSRTTGISKEEADKSAEVVFIHTNFSRYHTKTNLLRKLITPNS